MNEPKQEFLRRGQVLSWLEGEGISRAQTRKLMEDGLIVGAPLPGRNGASGADSILSRRCRPGPKNYYRKSEITKILHPSKPTK